MKMYGDKKKITTRNKKKQTKKQGLKRIPLFVEIFTNVEHFGF